MKRFKTFYITSIHRHFILGGFAKIGEFQNEQSKARHHTSNSESRTFNQEPDSQLIKCVKIRS